MIIPCLNVGATLDAQLEALSAQIWDGDVEVVVVDNRSTDDTAEIARAWHARDQRIRLVEAGDRASLSYARNAGAADSTGPKLLFCDGDDVVHPGWLAGLADGLDRFDLVTGALDVDRLNSAVLAKSRGPGDVRPTFFDIFPVLGGCNMGMSREVFEAVGGFLDGWTNEDKKFSFDAVRRGYEIGFVPTAVVAYRYRTDSAGLWRQGMNYGRGRVQVAHDLRAHGWSTPPRLAGLRSWGWLVVHLPDLIDRDRRPSWIWVAANRIGQLRGSVKYRIVFL